MSIGKRLLEVVNLIAFALMKRLHSNLMILISMSKTATSRCKISADLTYSDLTLSE